MSYSRTCHLSSLEISEGDEVVLIPVKYGYISKPHLAKHHKKPSPFLGQG